MTSFKVLCPLHEETTPSCRIWSNGEFFCYSCHQTGFVQDYDKLNQIFMQEQRKELEKLGQLCLPW